MILSKLGTVLQASANGASYTWNGPVCPTCHRGYIGQHTCLPADLEALIARLQAKLDEVRAVQR